MANSNPKISVPSFLCVFIAVILLRKNLVVAEDNVCNPDISRFLPAPYGNISNMVCKAVWCTFVIRYFQSEDNVMTIVLSATYTTGWVGMGFSKDGMMVGSSAMVGWIGEGSQATIKQYKLLDTNPAQVIPDDGNLNLTDVPPAIALHGSSIYLGFQLRFANRDPQQSILLAFGSIYPVDNRLSEHDDRTSIWFNFSKGSVTGVEKNVNGAQQNHGLLGLIGWGVLLPSGAIIARHYRHHDPQWFYLHTFIQSVGFVVVIGSLVTGQLLYHYGDPDVASHRIIGYSAFILGILQVLAFIARPSLDSKIRRYWNWYHGWVGRTALFLGSMNIVIGLQLQDTPNVWKVGYGFLLVAILVTVIVLEALLWARKPVTTIPPAFKTDVKH